MQIPASVQEQYSNSSSKVVNHSNSTVSAREVLSSITDLVPNPDFNPWYVKHLRRLGSARFMELANKARAGSDTPQILFKWMLENNEVVR